MNEPPRINLITRLKAGYESFSSSETRIVDAIIAAPSEVPTFSSQELARICDVSQSSVIKFCQKLGYKGFPALKLALSAEMGRSENERLVHQNIFSDDPIGSVAQKLYESKVGALAGTMRINSGADLEAAVTLIEKASRIIIFGVGGSALVALDLTWKLSKFGKAVIFSGDSHAQLANLVSFTPQDLLVAISYLGRTNEVRVAVEHANANGIPVLAICGLGAQPFDLQNGIMLTCVADENLVRSSSIATRTAQFAITDLLFVSMTQRLDNVADRILQSQKILQKLS